MNHKPHTICEHQGVSGIKAPHLEVRVKVPFTPGLKTAISANIPAFVGIEILWDQSGEKLMQMILTHLI